jgi:L,D-transpeptidase ErfK/SrfK
MFVFSLADYQGSSDPLRDGMKQTKPKRFAHGERMKKWLHTFAVCCANTLSCAWATIYALPTDGSAVIGTEERTRATRQDTLLDIARHFSVGYEEIVRANPGVNVWLPGDNTSILLPGRHILPSGPREGIVVNLPEHRLYFYPKPRSGENAVVLTYPVGIGRPDQRSPLGQTWILTKERNPNWYPTLAIRQEHAADGDPLPRVVPAGPDNPLGAFKMRLGFGHGTYEIHATNMPAAVGMAVTHGCILMYPEDLATLFPQVPVGTRVSLINEPVKVTYLGGKLLLEAHPALESGSRSSDADLRTLSEMFAQALGARTAAIHWDFARQALRAAMGMPTTIGLGAEAPVTAQAR